MSSPDDSPNKSEVCTQAAPTRPEDAAAEAQSTEGQSESAATEQFKLGPREIVILSTLAALNVILHNYGGHVLMWLDGLIGNPENHSQAPG